jgi:murein DD-endopeptidase MepM/ murein hydrolase activator NlpD
LTQTQQYNRFDRQVASGINVFFASLSRYVQGFFALLDRKLTVMVVPHSHDQVVHLQTNVFSLALGILLVAGIASTFFVHTKNALQSDAEIAALREQNRETMASFDELRDENNNLLQTARRFQSSLSKSLSLLGVVPSGTSQDQPGRTGDLAGLLSTNDLAAGTVREARDIKQFNAYLENSIEPVERMGKMLELHGTLFTDIPSIWPLKGSTGHISMQFGQAINPITGQFYIHKGLDVSTYRIGDPVQVTANGQVVGINYDPTGYGNYLIVKHKYGLYTLYAHLHSVRVHKGAFVTQGQVFGYIGDTGVVTGPHLHYEVHVGSDVVDPLKYVNLKVPVQEQ